MGDVVKLAPGYDWKQTAKKVGVRAGVAAGSAVLALFADPTFIQTMTVGAPRQTTLVFLGLNMLATSFLDALKHKND